MKVLLPTPGTPLRPRRKARPLCGSKPVQQRVGAQAVVLARRLQQRDGLGHRTALARAGLAEHVIQQLLIGQHGPGQCVCQALTWALRICSSTSFALAGIGVPGP